MCNLYLTTLQMHKLCVKQALILWCALYLGVIAVCQGSVSLTSANVKQG